ncbi:MAG: tryptophan synthase subunit alpha [Alphaproteobacteria bacterium]|nr:tryptophan synthase subunit alpha [Alphaproteobacteria bacterium]
MSGQRDRIAERFAKLKAENRGGLVTFLSAGDPDRATAQELLDGLPIAGADLIELGMPFSDPMADGPAIQAGSLRALKSGASMARTLEHVHAFRRHDQDTPIVLMGYYNPIYRMGGEAFVAAARDAGADGVIVVDLPPEEDEELRPLVRRAGLHFIRLATPTTDDARLPAVLGNSSGFLYYVSIAGITGTRSAAEADMRRAVERLKRNSQLPIAVGFGIRTPEQAAAAVRIADAAVVGSALVEVLARNLGKDGRATPGLVADVHNHVRALAEGVRGARVQQAEAAR